MTLIDANEIISKLIPTIPDLIAQLIATGILFLVLKKFVWNKLQAYLARRAEYIEKQIKDAEMLKLEAKQSLQQSKETYKHATLEYQKTVGKAKEDALLVKQEIMSQSEIEAKQRLEEADRQIQLKREKMEEAIKNEIVDVALEATKKVLDYEMDQQTNRNIVESFIEELKH